MFWGKVFQTKYDLVVAICDEELLDTEIDKKLKIKVSKNFYGGKLIDEEIALELMKKATICNLIGKKIVELAEKSGFVTKENIISINGVSHAQFIKI
ncbi:MAG: DUF424 family protein [Candidatus Aenigmatarchaeota archaeon]